MLSWSDNSYGNASTLNGDGVEGTAATYASVYPIAQQSQNLVFVGGNPFLNATYNYELFAVTKGAGSGGARVASVGITVVVGSGIGNTTDFETFPTGVSVHYKGPGVTMTYASVPAGAGSYTVPAPYGSLWTVADEWGLGRIATASTTDDFDERVVDDGTGNRVWRMSNAVTSGSFSDLPNSPNSLAAGESTAFLWNHRGLNHTAPVISPRAPATTRNFHGGFRFKSATGAAQTGLTLNVSPTARQSERRNSFVGLVDSGSGLSVTFYDTGIGGIFAPSATVIASGLSYADWHKIDIYVEFVDGLNGNGSGNDIVTVLVNDVPVHVGTTWETFYRVSTPTRPVGAVDALFFRASGTAEPGNQNNGFFFDDVVVDNCQLIVDDEKPEALDSMVTPGAVAVTDTLASIVVTAVIDDSLTGGSDIVSAEFSVNGGDWTAMSASDTAFNSASENVTGTFTLTSAGISTPGVYSVCVRGTDAAGNVSDLDCGSFTVIKATPTATLAVSNSPQTYTGSGQSAMVTIFASSVPGTVSNISTGGAATQTNAGTYAVTADFIPNDTTNYNTLYGLSAGNFVINGLSFTGFHSPIGGSVENGNGGTISDPVRTIKLGSTLPVKFSLSTNGVPFLTGIHTISAVYKAGPSYVADENAIIVSTDAASTGNQFRLTDGQWHFNVNTKGWKVGVWLFTATLADGTTRSVYIGIKK